MTLSVVDADHRDVTGRVSGRGDGDDAPVGADSVRLCANSPNGPSSSAIGAGAKPAGSGWRRMRRMTRGNAPPRKLQLVRADAHGRAHVRQPVDVIAVVVCQHDL